MAVGAVTIHTSILIPSYCCYRRIKIGSIRNKAPVLLSTNYCRCRVTGSTRTNAFFSSFLNVDSSSLHQNCTSDSLRPNGNSTSPIDEGLVSSAAAIAATIRGVSASPVEIMQRIVKDGKDGLVLPSPDFQRLCIDLLDLFHTIVNPDAVLSVYVRPAGSYVMDRLELRRVTFYPGMYVAETADVVILIGNFSMPTGLRAAEAALSNHEVQVIPECKAVVFPMVKHPFIVGFLVAEFPAVEFEMGMNGQKDGRQIPVCPSPDGSYGIPSTSDGKMWEIQALKEDLMKKYHQLTIEQILKAVKISRSLAMAYIMDQKAMLLQQSSWQNNVRMSNLIEQIRGPLSSIRTLSKMLSVNMKRSEISHDIIEDILVQGDHMKDALQQLQEAVYLTKANIMQYNGEILKKMLNSTLDHPESLNPQLTENVLREGQENNEYSALSLGIGARDSQMPMPPVALAAAQESDIRPCNISDILADLVGAAGPLARKQKRSLRLSDFLQPLQVAVEESALRQALSNLMEGALLRTHVGGTVEIVSTAAPAGGALILIDDDGPDMHYMTQMHSLTPFGADLFTVGTVEDNMTWNFIAGLTVAREILESYGCVVRVISPRLPDAALGAGGTRIELWLPAFPSNPNKHTHEA